jgi:hypothetical protein
MMKKTLRMLPLSGILSLSVLAGVLATSAFGQPFEGIPAKHNEQLGGFGAFEIFLQQHPRLKTELEAHPDQINNPQFVEKHPSLREFYSKHPEVRGEMKQNAADFMRRERAQMAYNTGFSNFHDYLKSHLGVEEQLEKNPGLADNQQFLNQHPELRAYLQSHPQVSWQMKHDPRQFFARENQSLENPSGAPRAVAPRAVAPPRTTKPAESPATKMHP